MLAVVVELVEDVRRGWNPNHVGKSRTRREKRIPGDSVISNHCIKEVTSRTFPNGVGTAQRREPAVAATRHQRPRAGIAIVARDRNSAVRVLSACEHNPEPIVLKDKILERRGRPAYRGQQASGKEKRSE